MTDFAPGLIRYRPAVRMHVGEAGGVTGRLQSCIFRMAVRATERRIYLIVADEAIRHPGKMLRRRKIGFKHSAMAGKAQIFRIQMTAHVSGKSEITAAVDRASKRRRNVPETKVQFVIEAKGPFFGCRRSSAVRRLVAEGAPFRRPRSVVAPETGSLLRDKIVGGARAHQRRLMAIGAAGSRPFQVFSVREDQVPLS